jgi:cytochrome P450
MTTAATADLAALDLSDLELWREGPPHGIFTQLRNEAPLHWSELGDFDWEPDFWSVVRYDDVAEVGRDWETFSSARSIILIDRLETDPDKPDPMDLAANMLITQDPPRHDSSC